MSEYEHTILKLACMASENIAQQQKKAKLDTFLKFMKSQTGKMLFDPSTGMWLNGPDYIADEYRREMHYKNRVRHNTSRRSRRGL